MKTFLTLCALVCTLAGTAAAQHTKATGKYFSGSGIPVSTYSMMRLVPNQTTTQHDHSEADRVMALRPQLTILETPQGETRISTYYGGQYDNPDWEATCKRGPGNTFSYVIEGDEDTVWDAKFDSGGNEIVFEEYIPGFDAVYIAVSQRPASMPAFPSSKGGN